MRDNAILVRMLSRRDGSLESMVNWQVLRRSFANWLSWLALR